MLSYLHLMYKLSEAINLYRPTHEGAELGFR